MAVKKKMSLVKRLAENVAYFVTEYKPLWIISAIVIFIMIGVPTIIASVAAGELAFAGCNTVGCKFILPMSVPAFIAIVVSIYITINVAVISFIENL